MWKKEDKSRVETILRTRPSMFGDAFGQHADYSSGLFYSGRREFLHADDDVNVLEPPRDFKNKKQMAHELKIQKSGGVHLQKLEFASGGVGDGTTTKKTKGGDANQKKKKVSKTVYVERFSSNKKEDWAEEFQAGCRLWVNHATGEVTNECPFLDDDNDDHYVAASSEEQKDAFATGHLVYDDSIGDILDYLDNLSKK